MGGPLSIILAIIHTHGKNMVRTENEVVKPINPAFYKRFAGDIYSRKNKFQQDVLFGALNNFYPSIKVDNSSKSWKIFRHNALQIL